MLPKDTEISPKILSKSSPKPPKWHPRTASGALPHNCVLNYLFLPHFGAILELMWEHILLTLGTFFNKKSALESSRIPHTFFLDFERDLGRPDMQSDRAGSIQTHVGTFTKKSYIYRYFNGFRAPKWHQNHHRRA